MKNYVRIEGTVNSVKSVGKEEVFSVGISNGYIDCVCFGKKGLVKAGETVVVEGALGFYDQGDALVNVTEVRK